MSGERLTMAALALAAIACGQTIVNGGRTVKGRWDASAAVSTKPAKSGTALPAACSAGEQFFKTDAAAGQNLYFCTAADTWTQMKAGANCAKYTVPYTQLTAAATSQNVTLFTVPAKGKLTGLSIKESVPFACSGSCTGISALTISVGRTGAETDYSPEWALMQAVRDSNVYDDGGFYSASLSAHDVVARFSVTNANAGNLGDGSSTRLTGGLVDIWACTVTLP